MYEDEIITDAESISIEDTAGWKKIHLSYKTDEDSIERTKKVKEAAAIFMQVLINLETSNSNRPNPRHMSLAKTSLEESCMWAIKSIHSI